MSGTKKGNQLAVDRARALSLLIDSLENHLRDDGSEFEDVEQEIMSFVDNLEKSDIPGIVINYMKIALMALAIVWGHCDIEPDGELTARSN